MEFHFRSFTKFEMYPERRIDSSFRDPSNSLKTMTEKKELTDKIA